MFSYKETAMNKKSEIKSIYDKYAENISRDSGAVKGIHTGISPVMRYYRNRKIDAALRLGKFVKGSALLEVGSNTGQYTTLLAEKGFSMVGIDLSDKAVEVAKENARLSNIKNIGYFVSDAENLHLFKDNTFDGAVSFSTLRYVPDLVKALKEIYRVIKNGGTAVLDFPNKYCPWFKLLKTKFGINDHIHDHFYSTGELKSLFREAGFHDVETRKILFTHYRFDPKFLNIYKAIDLVGENAPLIKECAAIILCKGVKA